MVHYIRYLRTPHVQTAPKKGFEINAVVAVTTDLGDGFLAHDTTLLARVIDATSSGEILSASEISWNLGMRAAKIKIQCNSKHSNRLVFLHMTTRDTIASLDRIQVPSIVDVWSSSFLIKLNSRAEALVERRLVLEGKSQARIWEETGDSIARHIWDASVGCLVYLNSCFATAGEDSLPSLSELVTDSASKRLRVLEVGAGCGIVGIALSQLRKCEIIMTDLEDAQDILQYNIDKAKPALGSTLTRQVLGWGTDLDSLTDSKLDLVLVSDCIYNPDSSVLLVQTLEQLCKHNPNVLIFVAFKPRHEADEIFFDHMKQSGLSITEQGSIKLPHILTDYDDAEPQIKTFVYRISDPPT